MQQRRDADASQTCGRVLPCTEAGLVILQGTVMHSKTSELEAPAVDAKNGDADAGTSRKTENKQGRLGILIPKEAISALPLGQYEGPIILVEEPDAAKKAVAKLLKEKVLGFDTESRPSFRKGTSYLPSLLQLCGKDAAYLFRLDACGGLPQLFPLLRSEKILKVGVAVRDDVRGLQERAPFKDGGFVEISDYSRKDGVENTGLRALAAHYLGFRISKGAQVTNWANPYLSQQQITYAATDAWVSRELYLHLIKIGVAPAL
jgi:hypothetical protein